MGQARRWIAVGVAGLVLMTGCANQPASAAAVVGDSEIDMQSVTDQLAAINTVLGKPAGTPDLQLTNTIVRNNVVYDLVDQSAAAAGVTVSDGDVDKRLADQIAFVGSRNLLEQQAAQLGIAPDMVRTDIRVSLLLVELADALASGQDITDQAKQQLLVADIQAYSQEVGTTVNPRFGVWDPQTLSVVLDRNAPAQPPELGVTRNP